MVTTFHKGTPKGLFILPFPCIKQNTNSQSFSMVRKGDSGRQEAWAQALVLPQPLVTRGHTDPGALVQPNLHQSSSEPQPNTWFMFWATSDAALPLWFLIIKLIIFAVFKK